MDAHNLHLFSHRGAALFESNWLAADCSRRAICFSLPPYESRGRTSRGRTMVGAAECVTTTKSEYQATCTSARIALHAGAIPHQPGIAALAAHLALAVVRPGEPGLSYASRFSVG